MPRTVSFPHLISAHLAQSATLPSTSSSLNAPPTVTPSFADGSPGAVLAKRNCSSWISVEGGGSNVQGEDARARLRVREWSK